MDTPKYEDTQPIEPVAAPESGESSSSVPSYADTKPVKELSAWETYKAGVERLERAMTFGLSDAASNLEHKILPEFMTEKPEDMLRRREQFEQENPNVGTAIDIAGGMAPIIATGGAAALVPTALKGAAKTAATIGASALEGGAFGTGNVISDMALGDPTLNAEKIAAHIGGGFLMGGGVGAAFKGIESAVPGIGRAIRGLFGKNVKGAIGEEAAKEAVGNQVANNLEEQIVKGAGQAAPVENPVSSEITGAEMPGHEPIIEAPQPKGKTGVQPTTLEQLQAQNEAALERGENLELPAKPILEDALSRVELENPVNPMQVDSLSSQAKRNQYKVHRLGTDEIGQTIQNLEGLQKKELTSKLGETIEGISPKEVTADKEEAGNLVTEAFKKGYQEEQAALKPMFETLGKLPTHVNPEEVVPSFLDSVTKAVPGVAKMFEESEGEIVAKKYNTTWGIDRATYNAVKEAFESLKDSDKNIESLWNARSGLDQHVDILAQGQAPAQIRNIKAALMDLLQTFAEGTAPDIKVREFFKRYAINEQERSVIEKIFGSSVGKAEFGAISKIKPETILDKIFSNTASVKAAKAILTPEEFNHLLANYMAVAKRQFTDPELGQFSSHRFATWLKNKQYVLREAFADKPVELRRIHDLTTISKILPDSASINPSGTAYTVTELAKKLEGVGDLPTLAYKLAKKATIDKIEHSIRVSNVNAMLEGRAAQATAVEKIGEMIKKADAKISSGAKAIFNSPARGGIIKGGVGGGAKEQGHDYEKVTKKLNEFSVNPTGLPDHLAQGSDTLYHTAPNITQALHSSTMAQISFLSQKMPRPTMQTMMSAEWKPTPSQKAQFMRYYSAVHDPIGALKQVKDGALTNETMEALQAVHPKLLAEMRQKVIENINQDKARSLGYAQKISLSKFMGEPMDNGLIPGILLNNQAAMAAPSPQAQEQARFSKSQMAKSKTPGLYATATQKLEQGEA